MSINEKYPIATALGLSALVIGGLIAIGGWLSACPNCEKWFSSTTIKKKLIS